MTNFGLKGRVTIIASEPGVIGTELALEFARAGATLVLAGPQRPPLDALVRKIGEQDAKAVAIPTVLTSHSEVNSLIAETVKRYGRVDVMVNNINQPRDFSEGSWERCRDFNLTGTYFCCMAASKQMIKQQSGSLINIAMMTGGTDSASHHLPWDVEWLSKMFAYKWSLDNINVNCITPGFVSDPRNKSFGTKEKVQPDCRPAHLVEAKDVTNLVRFLASPAASMITGETIQVRPLYEAGRFDTQPNPARHSKGRVRVDSAKDSMT